MNLSVDHTAEFERVRDLPRRKLSHADAVEWSTFLTDIFALSPGVQLRPWQAMSIAEAVAQGGAWLALPVGTGKTLISALLPLAMQSQRAMLIVPGSLVQKTYADFASYAGVWRMSPNPMRVVTREKLQTEGGSSLLTQYAPDLIIIDESDMLAGTRSAARRIDRYVRSPKNNVRVVAMTGTPARKTIMGYWHVLAWCLGDGTPMPLVEHEARMWASAIDEHRQRRASPGALGATLRAAREWYRQRLTQTPGVVIVDEDSCDAPLTIRIRLAREDGVLDDAFAKFLIEQETPGGIPVSTPLSRWLLDGQLGLGLYSRWNPPPPEEWREARRASARFVRERCATTTHAARPLDTEAQVLRRYPENAIVKHWLAIKPTFAGKTETVWISRSALDSCHDWLREMRDAGGIGIVWCGSVEFGRALAKEAGLSYYGQRGLTASGMQLHTAPTDASLVSSWCSNLKGFNLQAWPRQLIAMPPQSAKWLEQIFGRSHRAGQDEHVIVDVLATSGGTVDAFDTAIGEAGGVRDRESMTQKVLRADIVRCEPHITPANEFRWARKEIE